MELFQGIATGEIPPRTEGCRRYVEPLCDYVVKLVGLFPSETSEAKRISKHGSAPRSSSVTGSVSEMAPVSLLRV